MRMLVAVLFLMQSNLLMANIGIGYRGGLETAPVVSHGLEVFYSTRFLSVGASYTTGSGDLLKIIDDPQEAEESNVTDPPDATVPPEQDIEMTEANIRTSLLQVKARLHLILGLNIFAGVGERQIDADFTVRDNSLLAELKSDVKTKSQVATFGLGFMGRWDSFYFGIDLVTFAQPTGGTSESTVTFTSESPNVTKAAASELTSYEEDLRELAEELADLPTPGIGLLTIGVMF